MSATAPRDTPKINVPSFTGTEMTDLGDHVLFVTIEHDELADTPCEDGCGNGLMYSFNSHHTNFIGEPAEYDRIMRLPDRIPLSYYEHGLCRWSPIGGPYPAGTEFQWDGVHCAGVWIPDSALMLELQGLEGDDRKAKAMEFCRQACDVYTEFVNGSVYAYEVKVFKARRSDDDEIFDDIDDYRFDEPVFEDRGEGYYGHDKTLENDAMGAALDAVREIGGRGLRR